MAKKRTARKNKGRGPMQVAFSSVKGKSRAYRVDMRQMRYFPMGLDAAKLAVSTGAAVQVPYRPFSKEKPNPAKKRKAPKSVPKKVLEGYRRIFGGTIPAEAMKLIDREYKRNPAGAGDRAYKAWEVQSGKLRAAQLAYGADPTASNRKRMEAANKLLEKKTDAYRKANGGRKAPAKKRNAGPKIETFVKKLYGNTWALIQRTGGVDKSETILFTGSKKKADGLLKQRKANGGRRRNPGVEDEAAELYEDFHGHEPEVEIEVTTPRFEHTTLSGLGMLKALLIRSIDGKHEVEIAGFKGAVLCRPPRKSDAPQLYIEGGDQAVNLADFGIDQKHEFEILGTVRDIVYFTNKTHLRPEDGGQSNYGHKFKTTRDGEKHVKIRDGRYPMAVYDVRNRLIQLAGGTYDIPAEGISG